MTEPTNLEVVRVIKEFAFNSAAFAREICRLRATVAALQAEVTDLKEAHRLTLENDNLQVRALRAEVERLNAERRRNALDGQAALDEAHNDNAALRRALERAHGCATIMPDGTCEGCFVSDALGLTRPASPPEGERFQQIGDAIVDAAGPDLVSTWPPGTLGKITKAMFALRPASPPEART